MSLHRNESSSQKTASIAGFDAYFKENDDLSRERLTVFTQVSSEPNVKLNPEFVFKGKGTRTTLNPLKVSSFSGHLKSHRLDHMLRTVETMPTRFHT